MPNRILRDWTDSYTMDATTDAQEAFFTRLLMAVDDFGRYTADPRLLLARLYPLRGGRTDAKHVLSIRDALAQHMLIILYMDGGKEYLQITNWQNVPRAKHSKFPACTADAQQMHSTCSASAPVTVTGTGTKTEDKEQKPGCTRKDFAAMAEEVWAHYPKKSGKDHGLAAIIEDLKAGATVDVMKAGVDRYMSFVKKERDTFPDRAYRDGGTFFHQHGWKDEWIVTEKPKKYDALGWEIHD